MRANSGLNVQKYCDPILGVIVQCFCVERFAARQHKLQAAGGSSRRGSGVEEPAACQAQVILFLIPQARFDHLQQCGPFYYLRRGKSITGQV